MTDNGEACLDCMEESGDHSKANYGHVPCRRHHDALVSALRVRLSDTVGALARTVKQRDDLLEAAKDAFEYFAPEHVASGERLPDCRWCQLRAAIAKAEQP